MKKYFFVVAAAICSSMLYARNQQDTIPQALSEVVVTATKSNLKQSQTGKIVTVIDSKTIEQNRGKTISELLNTQAGIFINGANNNLGTNTDIYFRGASSSNVLIVVDGVPLFDPAAATSKAIDLNNFNLDQIDRIEILKGGQSTIWGSDALAGVVQIFLKKPSNKKLGGNVNLSYGSFNTMAGNVNLNGSLNKFSYLLQYGTTHSDGFSVAHDSTGTKGFDKDKFNQNTARVELGYQLSNEFKVKAYHNFGKSKYALDDGAFKDDKDYENTQKNVQTGLVFDYKKNNFSWRLLSSIQDLTRKSVNDSAHKPNPWYSYLESEYGGRTIHAETYINQAINKHFEIVAGLQGLWQNTNQFYKSISGFGPYETKLGDDSTKMNQTAVYASVLLKEFGRFNMELGSRINFHSLYGNNATFTINPSVLLSSNTKAFLNISSAFKTPTLYQLYSEYGNENIKPETGVTYEIGVQSGFENNSSLRIAGFVRNIKNLIVFGSSGYLNRDQQNDYGFEIESKIGIAKSSQWNTTLMYVDGSGKSDNDIVRNLYRRPNMVLNSSIVISATEALTFIPAFKFVSSRLKDPFDAGANVQPQYFNLNFYGGYKIKNLNFYINLQNITNEKYFDIAGYNSKGFNMSVGLGYNF